MGNCRTELPQEAFDDLELIQRSQAGDTEAFGELVTKYRAKVFAMTCGIVGNENDAWDLAQEAFLKAWRSIHHFEGRSSFYTWLYSITMNLAIDLLRRRCRRSEVELDDAIPSFLPGPGVNCDRVAIREQVYAALAQLSPEHRAVIVLKEIEDMHCHEIAEISTRTTCAKMTGEAQTNRFYTDGAIKKTLREMNSANV
jgi:RNA polymerase sigma-70 factor (ECF subfamily)